MKSISKKNALNLIKTLNGQWSVHTDKRMLKTGNNGTVETYSCNAVPQFAIEIDYKSGKSWGVDLR